MRRVVFVIPGPTFGGSANNFARLTPALRARGWDAVGILPSGPGNVAERTRALGAPAVQESMHRARATADPRPHAALLATFPRELRALRRRLRELDAEVVVNHGDLNPHGAIAAHSLGLGVAWMLLDTRTPVRLRAVTMQMVTRMADVVLTVGYELGRQHPGVVELGDRHHTIYMPVDLSLLQPDPEGRAAARAELGVPEEALVIGTVGNRNPQKGQDWLIRAAGLARAQHPEIVVRVIGAESVGHDRYERSLHEAAREAGLTDPGAFSMIDPELRVAELIHALDVLVVSSVPRSEGVPTVLLEAMACGIAVVSTDVGAVREVVRDGDTGLVVPPLDAEALAGALRRLAADPAERERLAARGLALVRAEYGLDSSADAHAAAFEHALRHRAGRRGARVSAA